MQWLEITIQTRSQGMDLLTDALTHAGFSDLVLEDGGEFAKFLDENREYWDYIDEGLEKKLNNLCQVKLYLEETDTVGIARLEELVDGLQKSNTGEKLGTLTLTKTLLKEENWEESWKGNYPPQPVGERLLVLPYWAEDMEETGRVPVVLDPGLTFGTGAHPSTQMVMEELENRIAPGATCLDLGSGSGILSIAALRLGARSAIGVDIDPKAEDIARTNLGYNKGIFGTFTAFTGNVLTDKSLMSRLQGGKYDFVLVNIVADVIIGLMPLLSNFLTEGSTLILSGILDTRLPDVLTAMENANISATHIRAKEEWRCVVAKRRIL